MAAVPVASAAAQRASRDLAEAQHTLALFELELDVVDLFLAMSDSIRARPLIIRNVNVVDMAEGRVLPGMRVRVSGARITSIERDPGGQSPAGIATVDGRGKFLMPGLTDMHVHQLTSAAQHLLHVATGVTTVRDMVGFPWLLQWRDRTARDGWLAPTMYVAGPIIGAARMGMYAHVVGSEVEARRAVQEHHAAGYDFIKVHNALPRPLFLAVTDEARKLGVPVVGHVPHRISVADAVQAGMITLEHLKGYIDDRTLTIATDDWTTPTRTSGVWNTPTLYTKRLFLTPVEARSWANLPEARYAPLIERRRWLADVVQPPAIGVTLHDKQRQVIERLLPVTSRFLAGTDAGGGYPFMVNGFALHEELRLLKGAGLSTLEALRAATLYPARALGREPEFGQVAVGMRADLLLLDANPLESLDALRGRSGVAVRGRWMDGEKLRRLLDRLAGIYATEPAAAARGFTPDSAWVARIDDRMRGARDRGYVFPAHHIRNVNQALAAFGIVNVLR
ncbi:MAG: amidohydrolase family protein [Gemmatimonadaceae bacterium]